jgi:hypothetical protein
MRRPGPSNARAAPNPGGYSPIWPPTKLAGCVAWLDCQETLTQAGTVTSITNMASATAWTEATAPPTYNATGINGRPCMVGNGSSMKVMSTEAAAVSAFVGLNAAVTVYTVVDLATGTVDGVLWSAMDAAQESEHAWQGRINLALTAPPLVTPISVTSAAVPRVPTVVAQVWYGAEARIFANGKLVGAGSINLPSMTPTRVGIFSLCDLTPDTFTDTKIGALLIYNRGHTPYEVRSVTAGLCGRWGIRL